MRIRVNGIELYYEKTGSGRPLLLVHGNGEDHTIFDEAVELLKEHSTCYRVDSRGHGQSGRVESLHYRDMAKDMTELIRALDLSDVLFYGFSDGGIIGLIAAAAEKRITGLIASGANTYPKGIVAKEYYHDLFRNFLHRDPMVEMMLKEPDISDAELASIGAKTLITAGEHDLIRISNTRHIAGTIPGAKLMILPGEDHGSYICHSTKIADIILREFA